MTSKGALARGERFAMKMAVQGRAVCWFPGAPLPPELRSGNAEVDEEHRRLLDCVLALRGICEDFGDCDAPPHHCARRDPSCEARFIDVLGDLLSFLLDDFRGEETFMHESGMFERARVACEAHVEDHANISGKVQEIAEALTTRQLASNVRSLEQLLFNWLFEHIRTHDMALARWAAGLPRNA